MKQMDAEHKKWIWKFFDRRRGESRFDFDDIVEFAESEDIELTSEEIYEIVKRSGDKWLWEYLTPDSVSDLLGYLGAKLEPDKVLDPACGTGSIISNLLEYSTKSPAKIRGIDINKDCTKLAGYLLASHKIVTIEDANALSADTFSEDEKYDVIVCDPPFSAKIIFEGKRTTSENAFLSRSLSLLEEQGSLLIVVPEGILFRSDSISRQLRRKILREYNLLAVLSLPVHTRAPYTSVKSSILLLQNCQPTEKPILFGYFKDINFQKEHVWSCVTGRAKVEPPVFSVERSAITDEIVLLKHLPIEERLGIEKQEHPFLKLCDIAEIVPISRRNQVSGRSLILRRVGNFKLVSKDHLENLSDKTIKNYSELKLKRQINIDFLKLIFQSDIFKKQVEAIARGSYIKSVSNRDLSDILVPLPSLTEQGEIADNYIKLEAMISNAMKLKKRVLKTPFSSVHFSDEELAEGIGRFSKKTLDNDVREMIFPIASVFRQTQAAASGKKRLEASNALFESLLKFMTIFVIAECYHKSLLPDVREVIGQDFYRPSNGIWLSAFRNVTHTLADVIKQEDMEWDFLCKSLIERSKEVIDKVEEFAAVNIRNEYLGHGAIGVPDHVYDVVNDDVKELNEYLLNDALAFLLDDYELVYVLHTKKKGDKRIAKVKHLMGDNRDFLDKEIDAESELEAEKVMLISKDRSSFLILDPLLHFDVCSECNSENVFFYDKRQKKKVVFFNYLTGHRPRFNGLFDDINNILPIS